MKKYYDSLGAPIVVSQADDIRAFQRLAAVRAIMLAAPVFTLYAIAFGLFLHNKGPNEWLFGLFYAFPVMLFSLPWLAITTAFPQDWLNQTFSPITLDLATAFFQLLGCYVNTFWLLHLCAAKRLRMWVVGISIIWILLLPLFRL